MPFAALPVRAEEASRGGKVAAALHLSDADGSGNPELTSLIRNTLRLELGLAGVLVEESAAAKALVEGLYLRQGDSITLTLTVRVADGDAPVYVSRKKERIGLRLDGLLQAEAASAAEAIRSRVAPAEKPAAAAPSAEGPDHAAARPAPKGRLTISADAGLFLSSGEAGRYFKTGYWPSVFIGTRLKPDLALGFSTGAMYFRLEGYAAEAQGLFVPAEVQLRAALSDSGLLRFWANLGAGAALFLVDAGTGELLYKTVPAAEAGLVLELPVGGVSLQGRIDLTAFLDGSAALYGFSPRIGIVFR